MGEGRVQEGNGPETQRLFTQRVLRDLRALEYLLREGLIESDRRRIGAEQEVALVNRSWRAAPIALNIVSRLNDPLLVHELALFNLEFNIPPLLLEGRCLSQLEEAVQEKLEALRRELAGHGAEVVLVGILPTLSKSDLRRGNLTPKPRYFELDRVLKRLRGREALELAIVGVDELRMTHDSVMIEACNTSFQVHLQVDAENFAPYYNSCLAVAGPVLACAANSPILLGKRLWRETRIAIFQEAMDTRSPEAFPRTLRPRVSFGRRWVRESVLEIYQDDIANFRALFTGEAPDPFQELENGQLPRLAALQLFNSSVYRWNRPCYGITQGRAHLRIENRALPSGPTVGDEVANAALWLGLVLGLREEVGDVSEHMAFDQAQENFFAAARFGMEAQLTWLDGESYPARSLLLSQLLPLARQGLLEAGVEEGDVAHYLGIVEARVRSGQSGARWLLDGFADLRRKGASEEEALASLTAAMSAREKSRQPVHRWAPARLEEGPNWRSNYQRVEQVMSTDFPVVGPEEPVDLVLSLMLWNYVRHIPVEDQEHRLLGIISYRRLLRLFQQSLAGAADLPECAADVMVAEPHSVQPQTAVATAVGLMRDHRWGCLPVVENGRLVGLLTERDLSRIAGELLEQSLLEESRAEGERG